MGIGKRITPYRGCSCRIFVLDERFVEVGGARSELSDCMFVFAKGRCTSKFQLKTIMLEKKTL